MTAGMTEAQRRKVLFLVPSLRHGGAEMQVVRLVNGIDASRFEAHLVAYEGGGTLQTLLDPSKVQLHALTKRRKLDFRLALEVAALIDRQRIDVLHCTIQYSMFLGWLARIQARRKPPLICAVHTTVNRSGYEEAFDRLLYRPLFGACSALIFVCRSQHDYWLRKYPGIASKAHIVFNGVDPNAFHPGVSADGKAARKRLGIPSGAKVLTCIAAFRPEKGHDVLIEAFAEALEAIPEAYLILAGNGPMRQSAERLADDLGLASRIRFIGGTNDVRGLLAATDATVLASTAVETFSIAMLESMSMGVPLVATDVGGTREAVLDGQTGLIVPPNDARALARGLIALLGDDTARKRFGASARALVLERFTEESMIRDTERVLARCGADFAGPDDWTGDESSAAAS